MFSSFNTIVNKHALDYHRIKGIYKDEKQTLRIGRWGKVYNYYRNKISSLIPISKKYYSDYFEANMSNIKKTWTGINEVPFRRNKKLNTVIAIKDPICKNKLVKDFSHIPNIADEHFASVGSKHASKIPSFQQHWLSLH